LAGRDLIHARDLEGEAFISLGRQDQARNVIDRIFEDLGVTRHIQISTGQSETTHTFVAECAGVAIVDPISAYNHNRDDVVARPFEPEISFGMWLVSPRSARTSLLLADFLEHAEPALLATFAEVADRF
jgi:DNA-binding transcriptional LysR family regulator